MLKETKGKLKKNFKNSNVDSGNRIKKGISKDSINFRIFNQCIKRAENILFVTSNNKKCIKDEHLKDCFRAAIVLSISALDAFIRKIVVFEILNQVIGKNHPLNDELCKYIKDLLNQDKLLEAARQSNLKEILETEIKQDFEQKAFQGTFKINKYMNLIGYKDIFKNVSEKKNINETKLKKNIENYTKRRHDITHAGDLMLYQSPIKENDITFEYTKKCIEDVRVFADGINEIIVLEKKK